MVWPANLPFDPCAGKVTQNVNWQQLYRQRSNLPLEFSCGGVMLALVQFTTDLDTTFILKFDGRWELISSFTQPDLFALGASGGSSSTPTFAIKTPAGNYLMSVDIFGGSYPFFNFLSSDGGVTWESIFENVIANEDAAAESRDGIIWGFQQDGSNIFHIYKDGSVVYTASSTEYNLRMIATHPTNNEVVAVAGWHEIDQGTHFDIIPWVVVTVDGGSSWVSTELPEIRMSINDSFEHKTLHFLENGRLVYLTLHETQGPIEEGPDGLRIWLSDDYTSWEEINQSDLWDLADGDNDWEAGPITGGLTGTSRALFFVGNHGQVNEGDECHVFMSIDGGESWVELEEPNVGESGGFAGLCYDDEGDVLYGLCYELNGMTTVLWRMQRPRSGSGTWEDVTEGFPLMEELQNTVSPLRPYTQQSIWNL